MAGLLLIHAAVLIRLAQLHSPACGEVPALASGVWHWTTGNFDPFRVNPPLVRMVAALPVLGLRPQIDWSRIQDSLGRRCEFDIGEDFVAANGERSMWLFTVARWACLPFSVLGGWVCWRWATDLYGAPAGFASLVLWCSHPLILGHGSLITADVPAASCGALAGYCFWRWFREPCGPPALAMGGALGLALLVKTTSTLLFFLWPVMWAISRWLHARRGAAVAWRSEGAQLSAAVALGVLIVHLGYGLEQPVTPLGEFRFISRALGGEASAEQRFTQGANRFAGTWLGHLPVSLPANYVLGIDVQKRDFEVGEWTYLAGEWTDHGRWWYYLFGLAVKTPEPALLMLLLGFVAAGARRPRTPVGDTALLLAPALAVLVLVSSQTGMNSHLRYAIPALPFLFIWSSQALGDRGRIAFPRTRYALAVAALFGAVAMTAWASPHYIGFFNTTSGGLSRRPPLLLGSSCDWGQDLLLLKRWHEAQELAEPLILAATSGSVPAAVGLQIPDPSRAPRLRSAQNAGQSTVVLRPPGWYAISVNRLYSRHHEFEDLRTQTPHATIGSSLFIYRVTNVVSTRLPPAN